ncbi:MAG TPA: glycosyltransferase [Terriglobales bacterium]|nr:glycosyltransferase [Terriglobales bacterium]
MKVLWIPHKDWPSLDGQRERWLLDSWPASDDDLHVLTWQPARDCRRPLLSFGWSTFRQGRITVHSRPRIPNVMGRHVMGRFGKDYSRGLWANEQLFRFYASQLVRKLGIDVLVYGLGHQAVGLPPFDLPVARVFDCLDLITYPDIEAAYIANSDLVLCTSRVLIDRLQKFGKKGVYVPNGVSTNRIANGQRDRTRAELGLQSKRVISLIGLTSSPSLFFVDALALAAQQVPDIVFLVVGGGDLLRPIVARCQNLGLPFVTTGWVPNNKVADYFAATDLGLYAGDSNPYFDAACPIKVLEYTAARRPVVATDLEELRRIAFPNVRLSPPDPAPFASAITTSLREPTKFADISEFEWARLAQTVQQTLAGLIKERRQ